MRQVLAVALVVPLVVGGAPPAHADEVPRPTAEYLVQSAPESLDDLTKAIDDVGAEPAEVYDALATVSVELTAGQVAALAAQPGIEVSPDTPIELAETQNPPPSWGLDRIDQAAGLSSSYTYDDLAGAGVRVYVVDTGVSPHPDLAGRLVAGYTGILDGNGTEDCNGHGTHVAGIAAGTEYGVAKAATIVPVRVFGCTGQAAASDLVDGLDWVAAHHPDGTPGVVNISATGPYNLAINDAVEQLTALGLTVAVAAGNDSADACAASPASAPSALTVGASTPDDERATFSNYGRCLDMYAPGAEIPSLGLGPTEVVVASGTSQAAPHVAGAAAILLGRSPGLSPARTASTLTNALSGHVVVGTTITELVTTDVIDPLHGAEIVAAVPHADSIDLAWRVSHGYPAEWQLRWRQVGTSRWSSLVLTTESTTLVGLESSADYEVAVSARDIYGSGSTSETIALRTTEGTPSAPTGLSAATVGETVALTWNRPVFGPVIGYQIEQSLDGASWQAASVVTGDTNQITLAVGFTAEYRVRVRATSADGPGTWAEVRVPVPWFDPRPLDLRAIASSQTALAVTWNRVASIVATGYAVEVSADGVTWQRRATLPEYWGSATLDDLEPATSYRVRVVTLTEQGEHASEPVFAATDGPDGPAGLTGTPSLTSVQLRWSAPTPAPNGYTVERLVDGRWLEAAATPGRIAVIDGLTTDTEHRFRVTMVDPTGSPGAWSEIQVRTGRTPEAPVDLVATASASELRVRWGRPRGDAAQVTGYRAELLIDGVWRQATLTSSGQAYWTHLPAATSMQVRVAALVGTEAGPWQTISAATEELPSAPEATVSFGLTSATITWWAPLEHTGVVQTYIPSCHQADVGCPITHDALTTELRSATADNLTPGTDVALGVVAVTVRNDHLAGGTSRPNRITGQTAQPPAAPAASATVGVDRATVTWTPPADDHLVTGYRLEVATDDGWLEVARTTVAGREATVDGLDPGTTYRLRLTPLAGWVPGEPTELTATTTIRPVPADARALARLTLSPDLTGDRTGDLVGVDLDGRLTVFTSTGRGTVGALAVSTPGWAGLGVFAPGDWDGDAHNDLMARDAAGRLWLYPGTGSASFDAPVQVGRGWTGYRVVPAGDLTGDRVADLLAIDSGGLLWLYPGAGGGAFRARVQVGRGWGAVELYAAGDQNRDGRRDILGIDGAGRLYFYAGRGDGAFARPLQVGKGWAGLTFASGADLTGDGVGDLVGRDADRRLWLYPGRTSGSFGARVQVGAGW